MVELLFPVVVFVGLVLLIQRGHSQWAGVLAGFPTSTALFAVVSTAAQGPTFVYQSTPGIHAGLLATTLFTVTYGVASRHHGILKSSGLASIVYLGTVACATGALRGEGTWASLLVGGGMLLASTAMTERELRATCKPQPVSALGVTRMLMALVLPLVLAVLGRRIGAWYAGVAAPFPVTIYPVLVLSHLQHGERMPGVAAAIIRGLLSTCAFAAGLHATMAQGSSVGLWWAMGAALVTLLVVHPAYLLRVRQARRSRQRSVAAQMQTANHGTLAP